MPALLQGIEDATDTLHVTTEGGQALLQGLLVADVRQHLGTPGQGWLAGTGNQHACTGHQGCQTDAFQRDGFATCVRAGDRHNAHALADLD